MTDHTPSDDRSGDAEASDGLASGDAASSGSTTRGNGPTARAGRTVRARRRRDEPEGPTPGSTRVSRRAIRERDGITDDEDGAAPRSGRKAKGRGRWWEFPVLVIVAIAVAVLVKTFLVQPFYIPSESMERTLHGCPGCNGDKVLVNKPVLDIRDPHPGDIVVFKAPTGWEETVPQPPRNPVAKGVRWVGQLIGVVPPDEMDLIKRVIATGGQTVKCCDASGRVQVSYSGRDGPYRSLDEPYIYQDDRTTFGPVTVPTGRLWVMGDHRGDSADSRAHCGTQQLTSCDATQSTVPVGNVIGKAVLIVWPPSRWRTLGEPATFKGHPTGAAMSAPAAVVQGAPLAAGALVVGPFAFRRRRRRRRSARQ